MTRKSPISKGRITQHSHGLGTVTPEMVRRRARELALINGRSPNNMLESDWDQARRELMGADGPQLQEQDLDEATETRAWDPAPGSVGHRVEGQEIDDEQTVAEQLVEEGVAEAEHDEMVEGTRESLRREQS
jgi:hypothetical protein